MKIGIYTNKAKDPDFLLTDKITTLLEKGGASVFRLTSDDLSTKKSLDCLIVLGGDGTILTVASFCAVNNIPILGINLGTVGFLAGLEKDNIDNLYDTLKEKKYATEKRTMLEVAFSGQKSIALNEVVLQRDTYAKMSTIEASTNGEHIFTCSCDGFIVATPTGSTAYSLSVGGPIISPLADCISLVAISPHSLSARPIILDSQTKIALSAKTHDCIVLVDGRQIGRINAGESIEVYKSTLQASFIKKFTENFFSKLQCKLSKQTQC